MADWEVWRQDDNGNRYLVESYPTRAAALARVLVFEAGLRHRQLYEVHGAGATLATNRDLYLALVGLGDDLAGRQLALLDYLCSLVAVSRPLADRPLLDGDLMVAMLIAAGQVTPVRPDPAWRVADLSADGPYEGYADFTKVLCTQITDLLAFEDEPPGPLASFGVDAPPRLDGGRATIPRWCNFDPATYLECAAAGAFGGWAESDGRRIRTPEPVDPGAWSGEEVRPLEPISWGDVAAFLEYGQSYE